MKKVIIITLDEYTSEIGDKIIIPSNNNIKETLDNIFIYEGYISLQSKNNYKFMASTEAPENEYKCYCKRNNIFVDKQFYYVFKRN